MGPRNGDRDVIRDKVRMEGRYRVIAEIRPMEEKYSVIPAFLGPVLDVCIKYGGSVTSWVRSKKRNRLVGGVRNSKHLLGLAVDIVFDTEEGKRKGVRELEGKGLKVLDERDHIHVESK